MQAPQVIDVVTPFKPSLGQLESAALKAGCEHLSGVDDFDEWVGAAATLTTKVQRDGLKWRTRFSFAAADEDVAHRFSWHLADVAEGEIAP